MFLFTKSYHNESVLQGTVKERRKKTGQTEKKVGRQYQGMDRSGVPEGSGQHRKMGGNWL